MRTANVTAKGELEVYEITRPFLGELIEKEAADIERNKRDIHKTGQGHREEG